MINVCSCMKGVGGTVLEGEGGEGEYSKRSSQLWSPESKMALALAAPEVASAPKSTSERLHHIRQPSKGLSAVGVTYGGMAEVEAV
jgi:hypothetical protein